MEIIESNSEILFIEMIANCLAKKFIKPLFLLSTQKKYAAYVGGLAEILDWAIEFYERYYDKLVHWGNFEHERDNKFKTVTLENLIVSFGSERMEIFYAEYTRQTSYFIEKYSTIEL